MSHQLTPEIEAELRAKINPQYADWPGTESHERKMLFTEIDRLRNRCENLERELGRANGFHERLAGQRDELLAALKLFMHTMNFGNDYRGLSDFDELFAALDKVGVLDA